MQLESYILKWCALLKCALKKCISTRKKQIDQKKANCNGSNCEKKSPRRNKFVYNWNLVIHPYNLLVVSVCGAMSNVIFNLFVVCFFSCSFSVPFFVLSFFLFSRLYDLTHALAPKHTAGLSVNIFNGPNKTSIVYIVVFGRPHSLSIRFNIIPFTWFFSLHLLALLTAADVVAFFRLISVPR